MCYSHPHLPTHPSTYLLNCPCTLLPTSPLGRYILNPTYMVGPTYLVNTPIYLTISKKDEGIAWNSNLFTQGKI